MKTFKLPTLPYAYDELSPFLSAEAMALHHGVHHRVHVEKLNELVIGSAFSECSLEKIVAHASGALFEQAAQHWNHDFFWKSLTPSISEMIPETALLSAIEKRYSTWEKFRAEFEKKGSAVFGSGWIWLVLESNKELNIVTSKDADNPLLHDQYPLITCDLWEHSYYVDYRNLRKDYIARFWMVADWGFAEKNFNNGTKIVDAANACVAAF